MSTSADPSRTQAPKYLKTGIDSLDRILATDDQDGGIRIRDDDGARIGTIILIQGAAGTGKTTLTLQLAAGVARQADSHVFVYSLEQPIRSLKLTASAFGFFENAVRTLDLEELDQPNPKNFPEHGTIYFCHLSPLPISKCSSNEVIEERFLQLEHMLERVRKLGVVPVWFLDSLNAFGPTALKRHEVYRLFELFRSREMTAIITSEGIRPEASEGSATVEAARFLADIVIDLTSDEKGGNAHLYLEIPKSRTSRQTSGQHRYKIHTKDYVETMDLAPGKPGIMIYPSIQSQLAKVTPVPSSSEPKAIYQICNKEAIVDPPGLMYDLALIILEAEIKQGACFAVAGPPGSHRTALACNLATGRRQFEGGSRALPLVVAFGESGDINFRRVAWFKDQAPWRNLGSAPATCPEHDRKDKWWLSKYNSKNKKQEAHVLTFKIGELSPEECVYVINQQLEKEREQEKYSAVVVSDIAEIRTAFPLLRDSPIFVPVLIDLFKAHGVVSVWIGENRQHGPSEMDLAVLAKADYRINLSHYPDTAGLAQSYFGTGPRISEQAVYLVIDNVVGKHYNREPRWLWATEPSKDVKWLHCGRIDEYKKHVKQKVKASRAQKQP
jgi:KaiC/GvpD/RAD55 family RecA-like ATPase